MNGILGQWYEILMRRAYTGEMCYVRYADDFLLLFPYENETKAVLWMLKEHLGKYGLELAENKTRILSIGRFKGTNKDFDFLEFTFYNTKTRGECAGWESRRAGRSSSPGNRH